MKTIPREAGRVTYSTEIRNLKKLKLNERQRAVIVGSILGDGCLCENWSKTNYRLLITQSVDQKAYVFWKYSILSDLILSEPRYYKRTNSLTVRTISHPELTKLRDIFYPQGKKIIPPTIAELIKDPITIAVWFMDDGNVSRGGNYIHGYHLNTQSFSEQENHLLAEALKTNYGIECTVQSNHAYKRLFVRAQSRQQFVSLVKEHVIPSMKYKLG